MGFLLSPCAQPGWGLLLPPQQEGRYYRAAEIVNWKNYMEMMPSPSPTLLRQVFANPCVGGIGLSKAVVQRTLPPMCSHLGAQHGSCSCSVETLETRAGAHVVCPALLSFCSYVGISCAGRHQEEKNSLGDTALVGSKAQDLWVLPL